MKEYQIGFLKKLRASVSKEAEMLRPEIKVGQKYVLREGKIVEVPTSMLKLSSLCEKKRKTEWIDPNLGLVEYIESQNLVVRWKEQKAFFRDEEREQQFQAENGQRGYEEKSILGNVLNEVFECLGERELWFNRGALSGRPEAFNPNKPKILCQNSLEAQLRFFVYSTHPQASLINQRQARRQGQSEERDS